MFNKKLNKVNTLEKDFKAFQFLCYKLGEHMKTIMVIDDETDILEKLNQALRLMTLRWLQRLIAVKQLELMT